MTAGIPALAHSPRHMFAAIGLLALLAGHPARAAECGRDAAGFDGFLSQIRQEAASAGVSQSAIDSGLSGVSYNLSVISHDRGQKVFHQSFEEFSGRMVNAFRLHKGAQLLSQNAALFSKIEEKYGVPGPVLVAIWGLETDFGAYMGNFPTIESLATLAWDCRRSAQFRGELIDALKLVERGDIDPVAARGAWAGEIGQTQFMPSSYLKYAVDFDGDGASDLIHDKADVLASTANFLQQNGWQKGQPWGEGSANMEALRAWNKSSIYSRTIGYFAEKLTASR
ncbi:lytic murein transglycosylase [uncultured Rhodoblastus sp.]|uniref:lytic murein transglycosylase n=1 Tax=uncultured Rhodoblastus sp. TaxID=543037 RepID=UPI0025F726E1|nr:lytic murein transglycosylase [uncultured Rhodoblastus sp.]